MGVRTSDVMQFVQMVETNDHEGEHWSFWLQLDGNEAAIEDLIFRIQEEDLEEQYDFTGVQADLWEVYVLLDKGNFGYGYMNQHHKVEGKLKLPNGFQVNDIYKGQIEDFFKES